MLEKYLISVNKELKMSDNTQKFIYVFDEPARDALVSAGFEILKDNHQLNIYVFVNKGGAADFLGSCTCLYTDTLVF